MSKIFYDHLINFEEIEVQVKTVAETPEEREELWQVIDEIIHHQVMGCVLDHLPEKHHKSFLQKFCQAPYDEGIFTKNKKAIREDIEEIIRKEVENLKRELLEIIRRQAPNSKSESRK